MEITVIISMYNVENYVSRTLDSVFAQRFKDFEVIIVDDCSTDNSLKKCSESVLKGKIPCRIIQNSENKGVAATRNIGLKEAKGKYVCFVDSDDYIQPDFLENLYNLCEKNNLAYAYCLFQTVSDSDFSKGAETRFADKVVSREDMFYLFLYRRISIVIPGALLLKDFLVKNKIEFYSEIKFSEDLIYMWRILFAAEKCGIVGKTDYNYYARSNSIMRITPVEKTFGAYAFYKSAEYMGGYAGKLPVDLILPRWVIAVLNTGAKILKYNDFVELLKRVEYKKHILKQLSMSDFRVRLLAVLLLIHPLLYYKFVRFFKK